MEQPTSEGVAGEAGPAFDRVLERVAELLGRAAEKQDVGVSLPPMSRWGKLRGLVVPPARLVLRVAQLITRDQREFNHALLGAVRELLVAARTLPAAAARMELRLQAAERQLQAAERQLQAAERQLQAVEASARTHLEAASAALRAETGRRLAELQTSVDRMGAAVAQRDHQISEALASATREGTREKDGGATATARSLARVTGDRLYADFEDQFRGTRELIMQRAEVYLPLLRAAGAGAPDRPILDLGCGRGELLEVLRREGLVARGADVSGAFVRTCRERGLEVEQADALEVLRRLPERALGAVTAIHVIEHLSTVDLSALVGESMRVLAPGGVALFETPNPRNLLVGACNFYMDPSHVRPLPPDLMTHLMERAGFQGVRLLYSHPDSRHRTEPIADPTLSAANELLFGPQDYVVLGVRP